MPQWPMPRLMSNHGNFIGSLGDVCRYLGRKAEELGVEIYPGFPAAEVLVDGESRVVGVATGDLGIGRDGKPKDSFTRGMELRGRYTVFAEGARGNLTKQLIHRFSLDRGRDHQKYGIGIKELWQVAPEKHKAGLVQHSMGWPLPNHAGGGSWLYHFGDNLVSVGFVIHLNYQNPTLSPFDEFQRFKTHPMIRATFEGAKRIGYGARAIMEGGWQAVPRLTFPGGCLVGDTAGFVNVPRIKGTHNAVLSGMLCAEHLFPALAGGTRQRRGLRLRGGLALLRDRPRPLPGAQRQAAVVQAWHLGRRLARRPRHVALRALRLVALRHDAPRQARPRDLEAARRGRADRLPAARRRPDLRPPVVGVPVEHQPRGGPAEPPRARRSRRSRSARTCPAIGEPARLYCPAGVYEVVYGDAERRTDPKFVINAQNCVHCKTCDIKDPAQNINWVTPEGGGGPNYVGM